MISTSADSIISNSSGGVDFSTPPDEPIEAIGKEACLSENKARTKLMIASTAAPSQPKILEFTDDFPRFRPENTNETA
jgi:hypothetical protein